MDSEIRPSFCRSCFALILKLLIFLQAFVGLSIMIYSAWVLNYYYRKDGVDFDLDNLRSYWFVCGSMGFGVLVCLIALVGHVAAESISGCCLCFYSVLTTILILFEGAFVGFIVLDRHWEEDLPNDPTGELKRLRAFIEANADVFKYVGTTVVVIQALSLLLAMIVRVMISSRRVDYDSDEDFVVIRRPLLSPQVVPTYAPTSVDNKNFHTDYWSSQMRQKYGLN